jgi:hypothetical protein
MARRDARADSGSLEPLPTSPFETRTSCSRNVRFIDGFAPFFREPAEAALRKYFIAGDSHLIELGKSPAF